MSKFSKAHELFWKNKEKYVLALEVVTRILR
jgi:hypothetical protein